MLSSINIIDDVKESDMHLSACVSFIFLIFLDLAIRKQNIVTKIKLPAWSILMAIHFVFFKVSERAVAIHNGGCSDCSSAKEPNNSGCLRTGTEIF